MFLIDTNHYYKRFKKPLEETFKVNSSLVLDRGNYISALNLPFSHVNQNNHIITKDEFVFILLDNADITIEGNFKTLVIEDISTGNNKINIINQSDSKVILIHNPQTSLAVEKQLLIDNFAHLELHVTAIKANTFIKNNVLINLLEKSSINSHFFINTDVNQVFDLTTEIIHKCSDTKSNISFMGLNEGKLVSQINSIIEKQSQDCELHQDIKHILFNENAMSYSKPSLMISTPCVASHGNSIGSIPEDWLFYLQTKGISPEQCLNIIKQSLTKSFVDKLGFSFIEPLLEYQHD